MKRNRKEVVVHRVNDAKHAIVHCILFPTNQSMSTEHHLKLAQNAHDNFHDPYWESFLNEKNTIKKIPKLPGLNCWKFRKLFCMAPNIPMYLISNGILMNILDVERKAHFSQYWVYHGALLLLTCLYTWEGVQPSQPNPSFVFHSNRAC